MSKKQLHLIPEPPAGTFGKGDAVQTPSGRVYRLLEEPLTHMKVEAMYMRTGAVERLNVSDLRHVGAYPSLRVDGIRGAIS